MCLTAGHNLFIMSMIQTMDTQQGEVESEFNVENEWNLADFWLGDDMFEEEIIEHETSSTAG